MNMGGLSGLDDLNEMYESIILDHYRNPRKSEKIENSDFEINVNNPFCGDELFIQLKINKGIVEDLSISGIGTAGIPDNIMKTLIIDIKFNEKSQLLNGLNQPYLIVHQYDKRWSEFSEKVTFLKKDLNII